MDSFQINLQLPGKALNPNARCHWGAKAKASKEQREFARFLAEAELRSMRKALGKDGVDFTREWELVYVRPVFYFKDARRRDRDNCSASLKAARDGICDAMKAYGYVDDDDIFVPLPPVIRKDKHLPRVEITVSRDVDRDYLLGIEDSP